MPFATCPTCGSTFHLSIRGDVNEWYAEFAPGRRLGETASMTCFECWKQLKPFDVVEVIALPEETKGVSIGDLGAVLEVLRTAGGEEKYEAECVLPDGPNKWRGTFRRTQLRYSIRHNKEESKDTK